MRNKPRIRFKGFTEDWEQRKLISLYKTIRNAFVGTATPYYTNDSINGYFYLESNNVKNGKINRNNEIYITKDFYQKQEDKLLYKDDIVIVQSGHVGHTAVIPEELDKTAAHALIMLQNKKENFDSHFINNSFQTPLIRNKIDEITTGNTIKHILASDVKTIVINMPSFKEQKLISQLFKLLDLNITLHQRKLEKLKIAKKALLQKLFPKNGSQFPEIRFKGFTDAWEQRKLSDISTKVTTKNVDVHYTETLTNSAEQGIISQVDFFDKEISNKDNINGYYIVDNNDFIYNPRISTLAPVGPINRNKLNRTGIMSPLYTVFRSSNVDLDFLEWYFQSSHWHRYMKLNGDSGARADRIAIKDSTFFEMPIKIPVNIKEQVLIGETLEKFNQYITLHQCKLDKLQDVKKGLLQKMFV
jgi:type I restriction enzyme S subunit